MDSTSTAEPFDLGELPVIKRGDRNLYPFQEMIATYFPETPPATVRTWLRAIGKTTVPTDVSERIYLREQGLLSSNRFLIYEDDVFQLKEHSKSRRSYKKHKRTGLLEKTIETNSIPTSCVLDPYSNAQNSCAEMVHFASKNSLDLNSFLSLETSLPSENSISTCAVLRYVNDELGETSKNSLDQNSPLSLETSLPSENSISTCAVLRYVNDELGETSKNSLDQNSSLSLETSLPSENSISTCAVLRYVNDELGETSKNSLDQNSSLSLETSFSDTNSNQSAQHKMKSEKIGCLKQEHQCPELRNTFEELHSFYAVTVNPKRNCCSFQPSTMKKFLERVSCFLNYCRIKFPDRKLDFTCVCDVNIVQAYATYQLDERRLKPSTVVRTLTALINLAKFVHRDSTCSENELVHLKNVQRQLMQQQNSYQLAVKAGLGKEKKSSFMFQHLLDTIKSLRNKVDSARGSAENSRILHDFALISLYATSMCGRSKELRTLQLFDEKEQGKEFCFDWEERGNFLVVNEDKFTLYENDFKTLRSHGPSRFEFDEASWLIPYLKEYIKQRKSLLAGETHAYMFTTPTGLPFTSSSFTLYLGKLFEREVSIRAGTTQLRHALVTHVLSLPESASLKLRESLATLMRHSLKHQTLTYSDIPRQHQTSLSRELLNKSFEEAAVEQNTSSSETVVECSEISTWSGTVVTVGDIVATLRGETTCLSDASIFLARVVKLSPDKKEAMLMEFRNVEGSQTLFRAVVGDRSWWEPLDSLVFPIDIVYNESERAYELRSSVEDIYGAAVSVGTG